MTKCINRVDYEKKFSLLHIAQEEDQTLMEEIWRDDNHETFRHFPTKTGATFPRDIYSNELF